MTATKLTASQVKYLEAAPIELRRYICTIFEKPFKGFNQTRCEDLVSRGLMEVTEFVDKSSFKLVEKYTPTDAGKKALHDHYAKQKESGK